VTRTPARSAAADHPYQQPTRRERVQRPDAVLAADEVQRHVDAVQLLLERAGGVVDDLVRAQVTEQIVLRRPGGADHPGATGRRDLHGQVPDPTGRRVHEHRPPGRHLRRVDQRLPGRQRGQRQRGGLDVGQRVRGAGELARGRRDVLGVSAGQPREVRHPEDPVARGEPGDAEADLLDDARHVPAEDERRRAEQSGDALPRAGLPVDRVHARGVHAHQDLGGARPRSGQVGEPLEHRNVYLRCCPCREVLELIANKWTALVIGALETGPRRFSEVRRKLDGVSQKVLTQTLRSLERDGLVTRTVTPLPLRVDYSLTELGWSIRAHLAGLRDWAEQNLDSVDEARAAYDARVAAPER
jgi:DNA-binding HxlR family transcriptional regulator